MAIAGKKPKASHLHVVSGTFRQDRHARPGEPEPAGNLQKPKGLKGRASKLWDEFIARAFWLTWADASKSLMWCHLQAEYEEAPNRMVASRIGQLRALGSELGFDPASRARLGTKEKNSAPKTGAEKYLT